MHPAACRYDLTPLSIQLESRAAGHIGRRTLPLAGSKPGRSCGEAKFWKEQRQWLKLSATTRTIS
jgi:hypothetical protein